MYYINLNSLPWVRAALKNTENKIANLQDFKKACMKELIKSVPEDAGTSPEWEWSRHMTWEIHAHGTKRIKALIMHRDALLNN